MVGRDHPETPRKTTTRVRGTTRQIQDAAVVLRHTENPAEAALWEAIRIRRLAGLKFRRQHAVGRFVLDFYCPEQRFVIELDGGVHDDQRNQDEWRTSVLESFGYRVLRFQNDDVFADLPSVVAKILTTISVEDLANDTNHHGT